MTDKEKIIEHINRIDQLSRQPGNGWLLDELRKRFGSVQEQDSIKRIEKYLGLDFYVDNQPSLIDYSFVSELDVKAQLISDNREMMRFRYGTRYHTICFDEFCRYAHLQAEMLLNYFYDKKNNDISEVIVHVKKYNSNAFFKEQPKSLGEISYSSKLWAFKSEFNLGISTFVILDYLRKIRNDSSHRSPDRESVSIGSYRSKLENMGMPLRADGIVDVNILEEGSTTINLYNNMVKSSEWYKDYKYLLWLHEEPYEKVLNALGELCHSVNKGIY